MKLKEIRKEKCVDQLDLALRVGTNAPMMSNFEHYKCLPIPSMLKEICSVLECEPKDIYEDSEIYLSPKNNQPKRIGERNEPDVYKLSVRLPERARNVLTQENLERCGYHSLKDFIWHCFIKFENELKASNDKQKTTKQYHCSVANESGIIPNNHTISINHLSIKINK